MSAPQPPPAARPAQQEAVAAALDDEGRREFSSWAWSIGVLGAVTGDDAVAAGLPDVLDVLEEHPDELPGISAALNLFLTGVPPGAIPPEVTSIGARGSGARAVRPERGAVLVTRSLREAALATLMLASAAQAASRPEMGADR